MSRTSFLIGEQLEELLDCQNKAKPSGGPTCLHPLLCDFCTRLSKGRVPESSPCVEGRVPELAAVASKAMVFVFTWQSQRQSANVSEIGFLGTFEVCPFCSPSELAHLSLPVDVTSDLLGRLEFAPFAVV